MSRPERGAERDRSWNHPDTAWALARAISPRPRARIAAVDPTGRPLNSYPAEIRLDGPTPDRPYALYLTDRTGRFHLLGFDLDPHHGPVEDDLAELRNLLDRAGLDRHVVCASGPGGGRHVWAALATPAPAPLVDAVARTLATRLPSLDITPLVNPATGCLRPPGAPHRLADVSRPLAGDVAQLRSPRGGPAQLHALLALLGGPAAAQRPAAVARAVCRDTRGAPHLYGDPAPLPTNVRAALDTPLPHQADASAALWTVLLGAARARWHLADLTPLLPTAPGLEHARTARAGPIRTPRSHHEAHRLLARQWNRAVQHAATAPPTAGDDPSDDPGYTARAGAALAAVRAAQSRADAAPGRWARPGGPSDRRVLDALCDQQLAAARTDVELDIRRLGDLTGVSRETARRALHRLTADDWVRQAEAAAGVHAARWALPPPPQVPSTDEVATGVSQALPRPSGESSRAWRHRFSRRLADQAQDVFTPTPGLGHHVARVYAALACYPRSRADLINQLGYPPHLLDRYVDRLVEVGFARHGPGMVTSRREADHERAARDLGVWGVLARRRRRHRLERQAWAWWLDELAWMKLPRAAKRRRRDPARGQQTLALPGLTVRQQLGPHPRHPSGRADYAAALAATEGRERVEERIPA